MEAKKLSQEKSYGALQRLIHWWIGINLLLLIGIGWISKFMDVGAEKTHMGQVHLALGYALIIGFVMKIYQGIFGPKEASFSALWHPKDWIRFLKIRSLTQESDSKGNPIASLAYLSLYIGLGISALSGLVLAGIQDDKGPFAEILFDDFTYHQFALLLHECFLYFATFFVFIHIYGMIEHERRSGIPAAQAMISGYKYSLSGKGENND